MDQKMLQTMLVAALAAYLRAYLQEQVPAQLRQELKGPVREIAAAMKAFASETETPIDDLAIELVEALAA